MATMTRTRKLLRKLLNKNRVCPTDEEYLFSLSRFAKMVPLAGHLCWRCDPIWWHNNKDWMREANEQMWNH